MVCSASLRSGVQVPRPMYKWSYHDAYNPRVCGKQRRAPESKLTELYQLNWQIHDSVRLPASVHKEQLRPPPNANL